MAKNTEPTYFLMARDADGYEVAYPVSADQADLFIQQAERLAGVDLPDPENVLDDDDDL